jgi:hypothetical protein
MVKVFNLISSGSTKSVMVVWGEGVLILPAVEAQCYKKGGVMFGFRLKIE